jgi:hypothetical protein
MIGNRKRYIVISISMIFQISISAQEQYEISTWWKNLSKNERRAHIDKNYLRIEKDKTITSVSHLSDIVNTLLVTKVSIAYNKIPTLSFSGKHYITMLALTRCHTKKLSFTNQHFPCLTRLILSYNKIKQIKPAISIGTITVS